MNRLPVVVLAAIAALVTIHADIADAARLGGGRSFGTQRSIMPPATRTAPVAGSPALTGPAANPVLPATPGTAAARAAPATPAAAPSGASRWLGPIAGLAAGLGLAALFSHLGMSEGLGTVLLIGLLVVGALALLRALAARRATPATAYRYGNDAGTTVRGVLDDNPPREPALIPSWGGAAGASAAVGRYPPGFDPAPFVAQAKAQFRRLQEAYDRGDRALLVDVTTPEMAQEIARDLAARGPHIATVIVALDAEILEVVREDLQYVASLRFHGSLREDGATVPQPFEEIWNLVKPVDDSSGWLLAGIQQFA